jgi:hypothetical protein
MHFTIDRDEAGRPEMLDNGARCARLAPVNGYCDEHQVGRCGCV